MDTNKILQRIGLSKNESAIYLSLINSGPARISDITKDTGIHRPLVYLALPRLEAKELVTHSIKGKQKYFAAESPRKLQKLFLELIDEFDRQLPEIEKNFEAKSSKPKVRYLEGKKGIISVLDDLVHSLNKEEIYYRFTSNTDLKKLVKYRSDDYTKLRDRKNLQRFIINNQKISKLDSPDLNRFFKSLPPDSPVFEHDISQIIYSTKVAYLDFNSETAFIIDNKKIADFQRDIFKTLWEKI